MMRRALRGGVAAGLVAVLGLAQACSLIAERRPGDAEARLRTGSLPDAVPPVPADGVLGVAQDHFLTGNFGYAARYFEQAAAAGLGPEAWLGLAAAYDRLRRFDLADRAYAEAEPVVGQTATFHNNRGFSWLLRGNPARARASLGHALSLAPTDPTVLNNLALLENATEAAAAARLARN